MKKIIVLLVVILVLVVAAAILLTYIHNNQQSNFNMDEFTPPPGYHMSYSTWEEYVDEYDEGLHKVRDYNGHTWFGNLSYFSLGSSYGGEAIGSVFSPNYLHLAYEENDDYLSYLSVEKGKDQLALVGYTSVSCKPIIEMGYTIPYKVSIGTNNCHKTSIVYHEGGKDGDFEKINNEDPTTYKNRMSEFCSVLRANRGEKFVFSYYEGTQYLQETISADYIYYIVGNSDSDISLPITKTTKGYFYVDYSQLTPGYYCMGVGSKNIVIEIK